MRIYLDKNYLTEFKRNSEVTYDADFNPKHVYRAVFSDGSSCSCYFGSISESEVNREDDSKCNATYGINFVEDKGQMSKAAWDCAIEFAEENAEFIEVPSVKNDSEWAEPDYDKLAKLGEAFTEKLYDSMAELTELNDLAYAN